MEVLKMYNYLESIKEDIKNYIEENYTTEELKKELEDREEFENKLNDDLWINDSVTGNASGSYTFNRWRAEEYVKDNLSLLCEALEEFGCINELGEKLLNEEFEYLDVTIRCYLLFNAISIALDEMEV
jgi:hypothetical protein